MNNNITIPISLGELIDKLSILKIKLQKIQDKKKLSFVQTEYDLLNELSSEYLEDSYILNLYNELFEVNKILWDVEDSIRIKEKNKVFDSEFIQLSRKVYINNDKRFEIKNNINDFVGSSIKEQKNYENY